MTVIVRFAPSPTGRLHAGNVRTALFNWLFARQHDGQFLLRLDDTDTARSTAAFAQGIETDLAWLGLEHDLFARQSERRVRYEEVVRQLKEQGRLYPCYETTEELERRRKLQLARGKPPLYDRAALGLSEADRQALEAKGRRPHWRFRLDGKQVRWNDLVRGPQRVDTSSLSDPVLIRADGGYLYTLPSVVDDIDFHVSHVIRGEDHVTNTAVQIELFEALGAEAPIFAHHNLLVDARGDRLSKRAESLSVEYFREKGLEPMAINSYTATIGSADPVTPFLSLDRIADRFDFARLSRAPARFDFDELHALNARLLHVMPFDVVSARLETMNIGGGAAFWLAIRGNITTLAEARDWWRIVEGPLEPLIDDAGFCARAAGLLPPEPWDESSWKQWTDAVKKATGARGKALFMPLRQALTGLDHGPELKALLPLIGVNKVRKRLLGEPA